MYSEYSLIRHNWFRRNATMDIRTIICRIFVYVYVYYIFMYAFASWFVLLLYLTELCIYGHIICRIIYFYFIYIHTVMYIHYQTLSFTSTNI